MRAGRIVAAWCLAAAAAWPAAGRALDAAAPASATSPAAAISSTIPESGMVPVPPPAGRLELRVHEQGSPDPVPGALVLEGATLLGESDDAGRAALDLPAGPRTLAVRAAGFAPATRAVTVPPGGSVRVSVALRRTMIRADEVVVRGRRDPPQISQSKLTRRELAKIPGTAGDALRAVQSLPGVASPGDFSGQLVVRGGGPFDNLYLIDDIPWPVPFHFGGVVSTVNTALLTGVDLYAAGFDARWGNATGAVLNGHTRPGRKDRFHATADINMVLSEAMIEGPLGFGDASGTFSGRRSYFDLIAPSLLSGTEFEAVTAWPRFWDLGGSFDVTLSPHDRLRGIGLATDDELAIVVDAETTRRIPEFAGEFRLHNRYQTGGMTWTNDAIPSLHSELTPYAYQFTNEAWIASGFGITNRVTIYGIKEDLAWEAGATGPLAHTLEAGAGAELRVDRTFGYFFRRIVQSPDGGGPGGAPPDFSEPVSTTVTGHGTNVNGWVQDRIRIGKAWTVVAGVHAMDASRARGTPVTPRAGLEWRPDDRTICRLAWGLYTQFPNGRELNPEFGNPGLRPNAARHAVAGVERFLREDLLAKVEVYDKRYTDLVVSVPDDRLFRNEGTGVARGVEVFLKLDRGERFFGWLAYARSTSRRREHPGEPAVLYEYDQPNIGTAVATWGVTPAASLGFKLRWNSGPLVTPLLGRFQAPDGEWRGIFGEPNSRRLADYLRLDLRGEYAFRFERWKLVTYVEILNLLGRNNPQALTWNEDYSQSTQINNLPRIPYLGIGVEF